LAVHRVLAFYGTTLDEPYLLARLQAIPNRGSHVLWCRESDRSAITGARSPILVSRSNIYIGTVKHYENLPATLTAVLGEDAPPTTRIKPAGLLKPDPTYVTNSLRDRRDPNDPEDLAFVAFGLEPRGEVNADPTETDVLDGLRTIIVGEPGTGKSELLRSLASRSKRARTGLFIRLADVGVDERLGSLGTLVAWAETAQVSRAVSTLVPPRSKRVASTSSSTDSMKSIPLGMTKLPGSSITSLASCPNMPSPSPLGRSQVWSCCGSTRHRPANGTSTP
jgi:hypothetical protein